RQVVGRTLDGFLVVVLADGPADHHASLEVQASQHGVEDIAADIVEIHVDTLRTLAFQTGLNVFFLVVDGAVEAQFVDQEPALLRAAGNPHHTAALELGDLPGNAAHG